jgi:hypothetical protein
MGTRPIKSTAGRMVAVPMQDSAVFLDSVFPGVDDDEARAVLGPLGCFHLFFDYHCVDLGGWQTSSFAFVSFFAGKRLVTTLF